MKRRHWVIVGLVAMLASAAFVSGYLLHRGPVAELSLASGPESDPSAARTPDFQFVDQHGVRRRMADWQGRVVVVNFWATWCSPCRTEIPLLIDLQAQLGARGLQLVGIALDDLESVQAYAREVGLNYPTAQGDQSALDVMQRFGNRTGVLPFTVVVDRRGNIVHRHAGPLTRVQIEALVGPQLE